MTIRTSTLTRAAVLITAVVIFFLLLASAVGAQTAVVETSSHTVRSGETLWGIAATVTSPGGDVRATIVEIKRLNGRTTSLIYPGEVLVVPASG